MWEEEYGINKGMGIWFLVLSYSSPFSTVPWIFFPFLTIEHFSLLNPHNFFTDSSVNSLAPPSEPSLSLLSYHSPHKGFNSLQEAAARSGTRCAPHTSLPLFLLAIPCPDPGHTGGVRSLSCSVESAGSPGSEACPHDFPKASAALD